jgi:hypothetical protein
MLLNLKALILPLATCALFGASSTLNAEDDNGDESVANALNLNEGASQLVTVEECSPNDAACLASAEIPWYPVYRDGSGWGPGTFTGKQYYPRRTGNPDRRGR